MKKHIIILALCFLAISTNAQTNPADVKIPDTLIMPNGSTVLTKNLDSVQKAMGWAGVTISLLEDGAHVHPAKSKAEERQSEEKLNSLLNKPAPDFTFTDLHGKHYSLASLRGKTIVLNFWFTQCGGCINEMPDLNELKQDFSGKDVVFLAITFDDNTKINKFLSKTKFAYTIIPDATKVCADYNIYGYPTSMVIDKNGTIKFIDCSLNDNIKSDLSKVINEVGK